ncbi:MAG: hypothetical protein JO165_06305, partial [Candidatus Eremiobacteraeota bacterium]|nr:hypothetical protein [Candidatus Eremiobacteraeota bacterium]
PAVMSCALTQPSMAQNAYAIFGLHIVDQFFWTSSEVVPPTPFALSLAPLVDDPQLRRRIAENGRACALEYWDVDVYMHWLLEIVAGGHPHSQQVAHASAVFEIEGGADDEVDKIAAFLASRPDENFGVRARRAIAWDRLLAMPLTHAKALCMAARRIVNATTPVLQPVNFRLSDARHPEIMDAYNSASVPPTSCERPLDFGAAREKVSVIVASPGRLADAIEFAAACKSGEVVVCWLPDAEQNDQHFARTWDDRQARGTSGAVLYAVQGPIEWTNVGRLFSAASKYFDAGEPEFARYREIVKSMNMPVRSLPSPVTA